MAAPVEKTPPVALINPLVPLPKPLLAYLRSGKYSDVTIRCGEKTWNAHKVVICSQCKFFDNACSGGFQEETTNVINLDYDHPDAVDAMLQWCYWGEYNYTKHDNETAKEYLIRLLQDIRIYITAEKYGLDRLKALALEMLTTYADEYHVTNEGDATKFTEIISLIYTDLPASDPLRPFILKLALKSFNKLLEHGVFEEFLKDGGDFGVDMMRQMARGIEEPEPGVDSDSDCDWNPDLSEDSDNEEE
ncbi:uncharacterized protein K452DRAFT_358373 [Aplosporella prunicola CBS 121167]|uniref:BTB domain-containing protein n=1 Tax=Aplosporella prunicola CBS 121167 TaxID=1176127 RepID=A0A6A6BEP4_9PEZI|nr:uncharacterized protein K452DRAFT_358373 [Aplosporella prunicola CBS 121167]KAF2142632.1 hypothetical protein K452DRAFT_358373 [Aplosporella prunicola CBS 121167]